MQLKFYIRSSFLFALFLSYSHDGLYDSYFSFVCKYSHFENILIPIIFLLQPKLSKQTISSAWFYLYHNK